MMKTIFFGGKFCIFNKTGHLESMTLACLVFFENINGQFSNYNMKYWLNFYSRRKISTISIIIKTGLLESMTPACLVFFEKINDPLFYKTYVKPYK